MQENLMKNKTAYILLLFQTSLETLDRNQSHAAIED